MNVFAVVLLAASAVTAVRGDYTVKITGNAPLQSWEGWGTSLCWWANVFGDRADLADLFFTRNDSVSLSGGAMNIPALGLNIVRYNIGGSGSNTINNNGKQEKMLTSDRMPAFKAINGFWLDWFNTDPSSGSWDWSQDAKQRAMLLAAKQRGADQLEAFSNSPPWWMTYNHATSGNYFGLFDNLQSWNYEQFAVYLATVAKYAQDHWGITFNSVEPFNEPHGWWSYLYPGTQEGCCFSDNTQREVVQFLRAQLDKRGLPNVKVATSDENSVDLALSTLQMMSGYPSVINVVGRVNTHGYSGLNAYRGNNRGALKALTTKLGKTLWDSEYGEGDGTGLTMAESIGLDINELGVSAFVYWQVLDGGGWGLVDSNPGDNWLGGPIVKYYVMAQYSRHIRPGMQIITTSDKKTVAAYDKNRKVLVLVTVNTATTAQSITFDLSSYGSVSASSVAVWTTVTSAGGAQYATSTQSLSGKSLTVSFPAASVVTIEIGGVSS